MTTTTIVEMAPMSRFKLVQHETLLATITNSSVCRTKSVSEKIERATLTTKPTIESTAWMGQMRMPKCVPKSSVQTRIDHSSARVLQRHRGVSPNTG